MIEYAVDQFGFYHQGLYEREGVKARPFVTLPDQAVVFDAPYLEMRREDNRKRVDVFTRRELQIEEIRTRQTVAAFHKTMEAKKLK